MESVPIQRLLDEAIASRQRAYAPYSGFKVGAAVLGASGTVYSGANVENAAYPAARCAEQTAVQNAVSAGERQLLAIAVVADTDDVCTPCGVCRQVLSEFGPEMKVIMANVKGRCEITTLAELLPRAFTNRSLEPDYDA